MAASCSDALAQMKSDASQIVTYYNRAMNHLNDAQAHWNIGQDHEAIEDLISAGRDVNVAASSFGGWGDYPYQGPIWWYFSNCVGTMDMDALIEVMLTADAAQVTYFIGLVDAYRQAIWNRPFNKEFFAGLARGFDVWG